MIFVDTGKNHNKRIWLAYLQGDFSIVATINKFYWKVLYICIIKKPFCTVADETGAVLSARFLQAGAG